MALSRTLGFGALLLAGVGISSCLSAPDYPDTPEIDFKNITKQRVLDDDGDRDVVVVTVSFKDGDGDLGLGKDEVDPPFNFEDPITKQRNRYNNNYFIQPQVRNANGAFEDFTPGPDPNFRYDGRFPRLSPSDNGGRKEPLKGDLNFTVVFGRLSFPRNSVVRFKVKVADRALHESNEVLTDPINID